jgi:hypothetical protein
MFKTVKDSGEDDRKENQSKNGIHLKHQKNGNSGFVVCNGGIERGAGV